jgi:urease accessory protein
MAPPPCGATFVWWPAATKIYRSPAAPASHRLHIRAAAGSHVEYLPGPAIPFRGARFVEEVTLEADPSATVVYGGILSSGRMAMGEVHAYDLFASRVTAQRPDGVLEFVDVTHLALAAMNPARPGLLGRFNVLGTLHVWTSASPQRDLSDRLHRVLQDSGDLLGGVSELPSGRGVTVRIVGPRAELVAAALGAVVAATRAVILGGTEVGDHGAPR